MDGRYGFSVVAPGIKFGHPHAAEAELGYGKTLVAKFTLLHVCFDKLSTTRVALKSKMGLRDMAESPRAMAFAAKLLPLIAVGVSYGTVEIDEKTLSVEEALRAADQRCYAAKRGASVT